MNLLSIDVGTTSCKAGLFDMHGSVLVTASRPTPARLATDGAAYYDPDELYQTVCTAVREVLGSPRYTPVIAPVLRGGQTTNSPLIVQISQNEFGWYNVSAAEFAVWGHSPARQTGHQVSRRAGVGILCAAGSLMPQTAAQIAYLRAQGVPTVTLNPLYLLDDGTRDGVIRTAAADVSHWLQSGEDAVLHTTGTPHEVALAKAEGARRGLSDRHLARLVSGSLAEAVAQIATVTGQNRLLIAGGETSNAVCKRLGVTGLRIWQEIQPGLPSCITLTDPPLMLVLKSGSFGSPEFFAQAIAHLKAQ